MANFRKARTFVLNGERYHFSVNELNTPVTVICYNRAMRFKRRGEAILYFAQGMSSCDPASSEFERYATVLVRLLSRKYDEIIMDRNLAYDEDHGAYITEMLSHVQHMNS